MKEWEAKSSQDISEKEEQGGRTMRIGIGTNSQRNRLENSR